MAGTVTASVIKNDTTSPPAFQNSAGTEVGQLARAWVNFNGTTSPGTIRASFNVSSVTKNGTGDYTVNFTNAMPDANFATNASVRRDAAFNNPPSIAIDQYASTSRPNTTTSTTIMCGDQTGQRDSSLVLVAVFR